jgi:hypothetical protein
MVATFLLPLVAIREVTSIAAVCWHVDDRGKRFSMQIWFSFAVNDK